MTDCDSIYTYLYMLLHMIHIIIMCVCVFGLYSRVN